MTTPDTTVTPEQDPLMLDLTKLSVPVGSLGDRQVAMVNRSLEGERILLVVTGSIAAIKAPGLVRTLRRYGAEVDVRMTENAERFVGPLALSWAAEGGRVYTGAELSGEVEHLGNYTAYLVAPASYDFINSMAQGRADTPALATMATALGRVERGKAQMLVLPCMNGDMVNSVFKRSVGALESMGVRFIKPDTSTGKLEFPGARVVAAATARQLSKSPLRGASILVTGGATPVPLDDVRLVTNIFRGKLGREIAKELVLRGANVSFYLGSGLEVEDWLRPFTTVHRNYDEYRARVLGRVQGANKPDMMILSAAVADYRPREVFAGKIKSKSPELTLPPFVPTEKVVDKAHELAPEVPIISFKLLSRVSVEELVAEANARLNHHSQIVVANRREDCTDGEQLVYIVQKDRVSRVAGSKRDVAVAIVDRAEALYVMRQGNKVRSEALHFPLRGTVLGTTEDSDHYVGIDVSKEIMIPLPPHPGAFGVRRKFHTHEGIDLYCDEGAPVFAMESGTVVAIEDFTGMAAGTPWWLDTKSLLVAGEAGVVCYGEIEPDARLKVGSLISRGQQLGAVKMVLRKDKGRPRSMLHVELHLPGTTRTGRWEHGHERPNTVLDPTSLLVEAARSTPSSQTGEIISPLHRPSLAVGE